VRLKLKPREIALLSLVGVTAVVAAWPRFQSSETAPTPRARARTEEKLDLDPVPRIDLARLQEPRSEAEVGRRDLFAFGVRRSDTAAPPPPDVDPRPVEAAPRPDPIASAASRVGASKPGLAPMNLKFIGAVGNALGVKVAVLVTEGNEVLTGQTGEVIANRYRIEKIGIESVDLEDVSSGQSRRIPLKGN
jgi:hypothetical protein